MARSLLARRAFAALLAGSTLLLASCGGGGGSSGGDAQWRVINLSSDVASVDVYSDNTKRFAAVATDSLTTASSIGAGSYTVKITAANDAASLLSAAFSLGNDKHYTGVVWGRSGSLKFVTLPEDEDPAAITSSTGARVRVYNATTDSGSLDVYITNTDDLGNATPTSSSVAAATLGGYRDVSAGTYRLRVTGAGDISDVRLDVPAITLTAKEYSTLVITAGPGGVLLNSALIVQRGSVTLQKNTQARVRVVAGAQALGAVSVALDGTTIAGSLRSPTVGPYVRVNAGSRLVDVRINTTTVSSTNRTFDAGADYTLLAYGTDTAGQVQMIADDNRLPSTGRYRLRLINGDATTAPITVSIDFAALISDVPSGSASSFVTASANSSAQIDVTSTSGIDSLFTATDANLQSLGVYTVFVLGGKTDTVSGLPVPTGVLRKDR